MASLSEDDKKKLINLGWMADYTDKIKTLFATRATVGELTSLKTTDKSSIVAAINENAKKTGTESVVEGTLATFPEEGKSSVIYLDNTTNILYRWSGTEYVAISGESETGVMVGATEDSNGEVGLVPQPLTTDKDRFLRGDGTWAKLDSTGINYANVADINKLFADRAGKFTD